MHSITLSTIFKSTDSSISIEATGSKRSVCDFEGGQLLIDQFDKVKCAFFRLKDSLYIEFLIDNAYKFQEITSGGYLGIPMTKTPNVHFLLVGKDEDFEFCDALRIRVKELNVSDNFHFLGQRSDIPIILAETDVFVLSSRVEGHPFVLLEAMACVCPAIATRCGGVEETVTDDTGYIVDVGDIQALVSAITKLLNEPELRNKMALYARARVKNNFEASACIRSLIDAYDVILSQPEPAPGSYAIDLFLQALTENAYLGKQIVQLNERVKNLEQLADKFWNNPIYRLAKKITGH